MLRRVARQLGARGGKARWAGVPQEVRSQKARELALLRWHKAFKFDETAQVADERRAS